MNLTFRAALGLLALTLATLLAPLTSAQLFTEQPLDAALAQSTASNKLLLLVASPNRERQRTTDAVWANPLLRRWSAQHAIAVNITDANAYKSLSQTGMVTHRNAEPLVFRAGKLTRLYGSKMTKEGQPVSQTREIKCDLALPMRLQWTLDAQRAKDPAWASAHTTACPTPPAPGRKFLSATKDEHADALTDPADADVRSLMVERYQLAKEAAGKGELRSATALLTWLWEHAATDAAFEPAQLFIFAPAMRTLAEQHPPALARFTKLRKNELETLDVSTLPAIYSYLMLTRVTGEHIENLDVIDDALNDPDAAIMMPRADRSAWELSLPRLHLGDPTQGVSDPIAWLNRLAQRHAKVDPKWPADQTKRLSEFTAWLLRMECCRVHANLLARGQDALALEAAQVLLKSENTALARRSLVASAVLMGKVTPDHLVWLSQASDMGVKDPALARHAQRLLKPQ